MRNDDGSLARNYHRLHAIILDKGYQGLVKILRAISPIKGRPNSIPLTYEGLQLNRDVATAKSIVENVFCVLQKLWHITKGC